MVEPDPLRALQLAFERTPSDQPVWVVSTDLAPLADGAEHAAHDAAVGRIMAARAGKRPGLRRVGTRLGRVVLPPGDVSAARNAFYS